MDNIERFYKRYAFPVELDVTPAKELSVVAMNTSNIDVGGIDYHADGYDILMTFFYTGKKWIFVLKNDNNEIDVANIASVYQGSGTQNQATFTAKYISEIFNNKIH